MNKREVIQKVINKIGAQTYLEIGVSSGSTFLPMKVKNKIAVDPNFTISLKNKIKWTILNPNNLNARYFPITSDKFFNEQQCCEGFDVVFIDGLHTHEQTLVDVNNSLSKLNPGGVIIMHDCYPPNETAAYPAKSIEHASLVNIPGFTGEWCGDVWKTICHLRIMKDDLRVFVLDCDFGLGILTRGQPEKSLNMPASQLNELAYSDLEKNRDELLNLKKESYLIEFLNSI